VPSGGDAHQNMAWRSCSPFDSQEWRHEVLRPHRKLIGCASRFGLCFPVRWLVTLGDPKDGMPQSLLLLRLCRSGSSTMGGRAQCCRACTESATTTVPEEEAHGTKAAWRTASPLLLPRVEVDTREETRSPWPVVERSSRSVKRSPRRAQTIAVVRERRCPISRGASRRATCATARWPKVPTRAMLPGRRYTARLRDKGACSIEEIARPPASRRTTTEPRAPGAVCGPLSSVVLAGSGQSRGRCRASYTVGREKGATERHRL